MSPEEILKQGPVLKSWLGESFVKYIMAYAQPRYTKGRFRLHNFCLNCRMQPAYNIHLMSVSKGNSLFSQCWDSRENKTNYFLREAANKNQREQESTQQQSYNNCISCQKLYSVNEFKILLFYILLQTWKIVASTCASCAAMILFIYVRSRSPRATIFHLLPGGKHCIYLKSRDHQSANHVWCSS